MEEEKSTCPNSPSSFFLFFFVDFSLVFFSLHIRESKKKVTVRTKKTQRGETLARRTKKKRVCSTGVSNPGPFAYDKQSVSGAFLLGERSNQTLGMVSMLVWFHDQFDEKGFTWLTPSP